MLMHCELFSPRRRKLTNSKDGISYSFMSLCLISHKNKSPTEYGLLKNLSQTRKVTDLIYKEMTETLLLHLKPKAILIAKRFQFHR